MKPAPLRGGPLATPCPTRVTSAGIGSPGAVRLAAMLTVTGLLAWLGWQVIANTSPRESGGAAAADQVRQVEQRMLEGDGPVDWAEVRRSAQQLLLDNPLESRAIYLLGLAAEGEGREDEAAELMVMAAARSLRDRRMMTDGAPGPCAAPSGS